MTNLFKTAALSLTLVGASTAAYAENHATVTDMTCAEFATKSIADQEMLLAEILASVEGTASDETKIGDVEVLCNGSETETVAKLLEDDDA